MLSFNVRCLWVKITQLYLRLSFVFVDKFVSDKKDDIRDIREYN